MTATNDGTPRDGRLRVPGATLYYKAQGTGPLLLVLQAGAGDADGSDGIARYLADSYTVVSYDRRGLSRSTLDDPADSPPLETHSDDVHRLLEALTTEPAFVVGTSLGALIGLDLVARHPEQVRLLVAHEAPTPELLPESARTQAVHDQESVEEAYRREGVAAMRRFLAITGVSFADREPDLELPRPTGQYAANVELFLTHHAPAARRYRLDLAALKTESARIVPAAGSTDRAYWIHQCARALADRLGRPLVEFPGGHNGYAFHPRGFAARLREVLGGPPDAALGNR